MKITNQSNIGWVIINGSGWNHHKTADALEAILAEAPDTLPTVPVGYAVIVAPISDKPFGLRCALVKAQARRVEIIDGAEYDDGPADDAGDEDGWASNALDLRSSSVERIHSVKAEQQSDDDSQYFIRVMAEQIAKLRPRTITKRKDNMTTKEHHTETPWKVELGKCANEGKIFIEGTRPNMYKQHVSTMGYAYLPKGKTIKDGTIDVRQGNADFIVRAVNSHDDLIEALREVLELAEAGVIQRNETGKPQWSLTDQLKLITRSAIAKAGGGQ